MVPHRVRGSVERAWILDGEKEIPLTICALGGSIATPKEGITAEVIEVHSLDEAKNLGEKAKGKIVFYNRPMDPTKVQTMEAYGGAVDQRGGGAIEASRAGGVASLVRSMSLAVDDIPHTGAMHYNDSIPKIPSAAVSTAGANMLSEMLKSGKNVRVEDRAELQNSSRCRIRKRDRRSPWFRKAGRSGRYWWTSRQLG